MVQSSRFRVWGLGLGVLDSGFKDQVSGFRFGNEVLGLRVKGLRFRIQGLRLRVQG